MTFHKFAVGVVLAVAMVVVLPTSALVFSARDFQFGVQQISPETSGLVSFAALDAAEAGIAEQEAQTAGPRGELLEIEQQLAALDANQRSATSAATEQRGAIVGALAAIEQRAQIEAPSAAADTSAQALGARVAALAGRSGLSAADQQTLVGLQGQVENLAQLEAAQQDTSAQRANLVVRQQAVGASVAQSNQAIYALQQSVLPNHDQFARVRGEANALRTMSPLGVSAYFAQGHPAQVSTLLVLLMGALGALLYLFPAYLNRPIPVTMAEIVVRLIFGMCAALAVYVLANAAIAGFSMGTGVSQATTSSMLNPFTQSLVGIVAGVLSEDIAKWIQDRGRGVFTQGGARAPAAPEAAPSGGLVNNEAIS